jgi:hypothetical protein
VSAPLTSTDLLALVRALTEASASWTVWKNADEALAGIGDIDSAAPESEWPAIRWTFTAWAAGSGLTTVAPCTHVPGVLVLLAVDEAQRKLVELDVAARQPLRGGTLFAAEDLLSLSVTDTLGFRRLRPGAEGVLLLFLKGMRRGGRRDVAGLNRRRIPELLRSDARGAEEAAGLFGPAAPLAAGAIRAVAAGRWPRLRLVMVEAFALGRALRSPIRLAERIRYRRVRRTCPVLRTIGHGHRQLPDDLGGWLIAVRDSHTGAIA